MIALENPYPKSILIFVLFSVLCDNGCFGILMAQTLGGKTHREMAKDRSLENSLFMLHTWEDLDEESMRISSSLAEIVHKVFSASKHAGYGDLLENQEYLNFIQLHDVQLLGGPMIGNISEEGGDIWVRTAKPGEVSVELIDGETPKQFGPVKTSLEGDLSTVIPIRGLQAGTNYAFRLTVDGKVPSLDPKPVLTTLPNDSSQQPVRIAFGTCFHRWGLGNRELANQIVSRQPHAILFGGDMAVQDRRDQLGMHRFDYLMRDFFPAWQQLTSRVPVYATWDDHDYMDDDWWGIPEGYTEEDRMGIREVFTQSWVNPKYGFEDREEGVFFRTRIGPAEVIMVDNRFFRDEDTGEFLGDNQMKWLEEQLLEIEAPFTILSCGTMWSDYVSGGKDSWGVWDPEGRERIFQWIEKHKIPGVVLISGDRHGARGFRIPRESGHVFYEFEPASLGGRHGPPAKDKEWDTQLFGFDNVYAFGEFTFQHLDSEDPELVFRLIEEDGTVLFQLVLKQSELTPL
ncbi:alkaline phosphatase D family protein [Pleomorphovibrio marinus]|uniref:alkaline phosphatase D family protein n=1 Tax=Pleomorphovibrio marinus TaxID=2164132 RepID=UPI000E0BF9DF|nr:alkaline phosphatase D family protein [Pleomorphovibrio marinus]